MGSALKPLIIFGVCFLVVFGLAFGLGYGLTRDDGDDDGDDGDIFSQSKRLELILVRFAVFLDKHDTDSTTRQEGKHKTRGKKTERRSWTTFNQSLAVSVSQRTLTEESDQNPKLSAFAQKMRCKII
jgi:hypothetical protein